MQTRITDADGCLALLKELFIEADVDRSGYIDAHELSLMLKQYYRQEGLARNLTKIRKEVDAAMAKYDGDGNGQLDFGEFIGLYTSGLFKLGVPYEILQEVKRIGAEYDVAADPDMPTEVPSDSQVEPDEEVDDRPVEELEARMTALTAAKEELLAQIEPIDNELEELKASIFGKAHPALSLRVVKKVIRVFSLLDVDGDGALDKVEILAYSGGYDTGMWDRLDADGDGSVTINEVAMMVATYPDHEKAIDQMLTGAEAAQVYRMEMSATSARNAAEAAAAAVADSEST